MKVTVQATSDVRYIIKDLPDEDCLALAEDLAGGDSPVLVLQMDKAIVHIARRHIVAIELD